MGQFSWLYADTKKQMIDNRLADSYLLVPPEFQSTYSNYILETCYDGYGRMGIYDIYDLIVIWNRSFIPEMLELMEKGEWYCDASKRVKELFKTYYETGEFHVESDEHIEFRYLGIVMACYDEDNFRLKYPIKITSAPMAYDDVEPSYSDPNQGWEIYDDDEDLY